MSQWKYSHAEYIENMKPVFERHSITKDNAEYWAEFMWNNTNWNSDSTGLFAPIDRFLSTLEQYGIDHNPDVTNHLDVILKNTKFSTIYSMIELFCNPQYNINVAAFFSGYSTFLLKLDVDKAKEAMDAMKAEGYNYQNMMVRCKELAVRPSIGIIKNLKSMLLPYVSDEKVAIAIAEKAPSNFVLANRDEIPKILEVLDNSTYPVVVTDKKTKQWTINNVPLFRPIDRLLLSNSSLLSIQDAEEIEKLNQFFTDIDINLLEVYSKNTSIYTIAKQKEYLPAYQAAIDLRVKAGENKEEVVKRLKKMIVKDPQWLVSINENSVKEGFLEACRICDYDIEMAEIYHMGHPEISTKSYCYHKEELLKLFVDIYDDEDKANEVFFKDKRVAKLFSARLAKRLIAELNHASKYKLGTQELKDFVDQHLDKLNNREELLVLAGIQSHVKNTKITRFVKGQKQAKYNPILQTLPETSVELFNINSRQKTAKLVVDGNNLTPAMKKIFYSIMIGASLANTDEIDESILQYVLKNPTLLESLKSKMENPDKTVQDIPAMKRKKKQAKQETDTTDDVSTGE